MMPNQPRPPVEEKRSIEVRAAEKREESLPPFWEAGPNDFMARIENLDPDYRFRWIQVSAKNQQLKRFKGWEPLEDKARIERYGFDPQLINRAGRVQWMDTELWFMPIRRAELIRKHLADKLARRSASVRTTLDILADDVAGRSRGRVVPFIGTPGNSGPDVFERTPISESAARSGKTK